MCIYKQKCKVRPEIVNIGSNDPIFYPFSIKVDKCSGNCNNINDPYAKICVHDVVKNLNVKVKNLMTLINETRHIEWHESCRSICRLDKIICNSKQWCGIGEYLDYSNCKCRKKLIDPLIEECTENIDVIKNDNENEHKKQCSSCTVYIMLFSIFFTISIVIGIYFVYYHWYLKKYSLHVNFNTHKETLIY